MQESLAVDTAQQPRYHARKCGHKKETEGAIANSRAVAVGSVCYTVAKLLGSVEAFGAYPYPEEYEDEERRPSAAFLHLRIYSKRLLAK